MGGPDDVTLERKGRGGAWVVAQFTLIALVIASVGVPPEWPSNVSRVLSVVGAVLAVAGGAVAVWAARSLGTALTPFPEPGADGSLVETGPFAHVRHPVYAGGLLFFLGWSLFAGVVALVLSAVLGVLWYAKALTEERRLRARYPGYAAYAGRVRRRLVPGVL